MAQVVEDKEGNHWTCFTREGFIELQHIVIDYHDLFALKSQLELKIGSLDREIEIQRHRAQNWEDFADTETARAEILSDLITLTESKKGLSFWIPIGVIILETAALGVIGVYALGN